MLDSKWKSLTLGAAGYSPWLHDAGSLTRRIQQRCQRFSVQALRCGLARVAADEAALLGFSAHCRAFSREVFLLADGVPVVFAHSTCARQYLRGAWRAMNGLGEKPLGALLFSHPLISRKPLQFKVLRKDSPLYWRAVSGFNQPPAQLWARRSLFYLHQAPLLVTEVFLPEILSLSAM